MKQMNLSLVTRLFFTFSCYNNSTFLTNTGSRKWHCQTSLWLHRVNVKMADFPCGVCKKECQNEVIQCSQCESWFHNTCIKMSKTALKSWSTKSLSFFCRSCSFDGDLYGAGKALQRYLFIYLFTSLCNEYPILSFFLRV